ncbi:glycosyltransferase family 2 protein [Candidatus Parcubacteria bacterium]|nr:glycosyltransferase family 2 protein [Candidatus Parcubacteria bacterium]
MMTAKKISAIIACYKDEPAIPIMYERLTRTFQKIGPNYEIVFVNDGSPDNSEAVLAELAAQDQHVVVINHSRNFSTQNVHLSGMEIATGDAVVLLDGDLQDPPELIEQFAEKWLEGYDVVYGIRVKREAPGWMQIAYKLFYRIFQKLAYVKIPLDAGDFSLLDRKVVRVLNQMPEVDRFTRGMRAWVGFRQTGVPYVRPERMFGRSTNNLWRNIRWAKKGIFSFSYAPLEWVSFIAGVVTVLAALAIVVYIVLAIIWPAPRGFLSILMAILFFGAVQLLALSVIGEYIAKIFEEVKRRPKFIVKSIFNDPRQKTP